MPGVPSCKGCAACAKQKKKCDQAKPVCSRCARLQIPCVGSGKQRYKFMQVVQRSNSTSTSTSSSGSTSSSIRSSVSRSPSNECTVAVVQFIHNLKVDDLRYDVCWSYGELLREIPKRLGTNAALDASASALSSALSGVTSTNGRMSQETYARFGHAVKTLRMSLADPHFVYTPETLCAIWLIWICQSWFGEVDNMVGHGPGIMRILSRVNFSMDTLDEFEQKLLVTIAGPVAFESMHDPKAKLNPWLKNLAMEVEQASITTTKHGGLFHGPEQLKFIGLLTCFVRLPDLLQYNTDVVHEVQELYDRIRTATHFIDQRLLEATNDMASSPTSTSIRHFALCQRTYAFYLTMELVLVGVLHTYSPYDTALDQESTKLCQRIIELCLQGSVWRPLGAQWITICLGSAWVAVTDLDQRWALEDAWSRCKLSASGQSLSAAQCLLSNSFDRLRREAWGSSISPPPSLSDWGSILDFHSDSLPEEVDCLDSSQLIGMEKIQTEMIHPV